MTIFWFFFQEKMKAYSKNPWLVENIDDFNFWCCPECAYKSKDRTGNLMSVWLWWVLDSDLKWIRQKFYQFFINEKFKKLLYFFICILPNYVPHEITKDFWKNSHFENVRADFLLRCQNSLRWEICLICHWNIDSWKQKLSFVYVMVSKYNQKII